MVVFTYRRQNFSVVVSVPTEVGVKWYQSLLYVHNNSSVVVLVPTEVGVKWYQSLLNVHIVLETSNPASSDSDSTTPGSISVVNRTTSNPASSDSDSASPGSISVVNRTTSNLTSTPGPNSSLIPSTTPTTNSTSVLNNSVPVPTNASVPHLKQTKRHVPNYELNAIHDSKTVENTSTYSCVPFSKNSFVRGHAIPSAHTKREHGNNVDCPFNITLKEGDYNRQETTGQPSAALGASYHRQTEDTKCQSQLSTGPLNMEPCLMHYNSNAPVIF